jgi:hypothetical protein
MNFNRSLLRTHRAYIVLVSLALSSVACTTTVHGSALKAPNAPSTPTVDVSTLDVGPYPTEPSQPLGVAGDPVRGALAEAQRMVANVVGPWQVDSAVTLSTGGNTVMVSAADLARVDSGPYAAAAGRHNFVNGFAATRRAEEGKILINAVLRFADPGSATAAVAEFGGIAAKTGSGVHRTPIPGHPETLAASYTDKQWTAVRAFTAHGPYVFMQLAHATAGLEPATRLVAKTIDLQGPAIDEFGATDPSEFADISLDPTGLLARTLPLSADEASPRENVVNEPDAEVHFQRDALVAEELFAESGTDLVATARTVVYQAKDTEGAARIVDGFLDEVELEAYEAEPVANLPDSHCVELSATWFYCLGVADRYAIEATSDTLLDAQQQVAAQYAMLLG